MTYKIGDQFRDGGIHSGVVIATNYVLKNSASSWILAMRDADMDFCSQLKEGDVADIVFEQKDGSICVAKQVDWHGRTYWFISNPRKRVMKFTAEDKAYIHNHGRFARTMRSIC